MRLIRIITALPRRLLMLAQGRPDSKPCCPRALPPARPGAAPRGFELLLVVQWCSHAPHQLTSLAVEAEENILDTRQLKELSKSGPSLAQAQEPRNALGERLPMTTSPSRLLSRVGPANRQWRQGSPRWAGTHHCVAEQQGCKHRATFSHDLEP